MGTGQPKPSIGYLRVICTEKNTHTLVRDKPERERVCCSATRLVQPVPGRDREINTITHQQASTNTTTQPPNRVPFRTEAVGTGQPKPSTPTGKHKHYNQPPKTTQSPLQETEAVGTGQPKPSIGYLRVICTEKSTL